MSADNSQTWDPSQYALNARFVAELGEPLIDLLAPRAGERILDLGCGDGALTVKLMQQGCAVVGVDASQAMVDAARQLGVAAEVADGENLPFANEFDAVFSNAALHWMRDHKKVLSGVRRALRPGGRFVAEFGGYGNVAAIETALQQALAQRGLSCRSPWYFPAPAEYQRRLQAAGFVVVSMELFPRPTPLPGDVTGWLQTFARQFIEELPAADRAVFITEVADALRPALQAADGSWFVDYVRLRFCATR